MEIIIRPNGLWDYTKPLRDLHGLVLAGRYFWVQNLGSSWCQASLFCTVSKNNSHSSNPFQSLA